MRSLAVLLLFAGPATADDYFPTKPGTKWVYTVSTGVRQVGYSLTVSGVAERGDKRIVSVEGREAGIDDVDKGEWVVTDREVRITDQSGRKLLPDTVIRFPLKSGERWSAGKKTDFLDADFRAVVGDPTVVAVPAGKYEAAVPVIFTGTLTNLATNRRADTVRVDWFVRGVGMVKRVEFAATSGQPSTSFVMELSRFTPGKD